MSWLDVLSNLTKNVGRGALDVFTLGGNELGHHFGGQGYGNFMKPVETGMGANFEAGAAGGTGMLGAQGLGAFGAGSAGSGASGMGSVGPMSQAGSTLGGGMSSPLNLEPSAMGSTGAAPGVPMAASASATTSPWLRILQASRGMGQGAQQSPAQNQNILAQIYQMFPNLRPGSPMSQTPNINMGGM